MVDINRKIVGPVYWVYIYNAEGFMMYPEGNKTQILNPQRHRPLSHPVSLQMRPKNATSNSKNMASCWMLRSAIQRLARLRTTHI